MEIVEFVGIPGSGKSYLSERLCTYAGLEATNFMSRSEGRAIAMARYGLLFARFGGAIMQTIWRSGFLFRAAPIKRRLWQLKLLLRAIVLADRVGRRARPRDGATIVLDQAVWQSLMSCRMAGLEFAPATISALLGISQTRPARRMIVLHTVDAKTAKTSAAKRQDNQLPALAKFGEAEVDKIFANYDRAFTWVVDEIHARGFAVVQTFRSAATEDNIAALLLAIGYQTPDECSEIGNPSDG